MLLGVAHTCNFADSQVAEVAWLHGMGFIIAISVTLKCADVGMIIGLF
jgi:hypothetical protein